jgi:ligand-binding SRPBCC domain-containing protein
VPISLDEAWDFFSTPKNLSRITPEHMGFQITSEHKNEKMFPGQIITYKVFPFKGISTNWVTEITHVVDKKYFVDEQRFGPYSMWHHEHWFNVINGGVEIVDRVSYKLPFGFLGRIIEPFMIRKQLRAIFNYRFLKLVEFFGPFEKKNDEKKEDLTLDTG